MNPIEFQQMTGIAAKDQPEYIPLPMYRDEQQVISCWRLSFWERLKVLFSGVIWMRLMHTPDQMMTPSLLETENPWDN